uniref:Uncharacterized protein n=1 Tax=Myoviridae sp. ctI7W9 TaxID=2826636 RepID=A0A8S5MNU1_9CAUD|nr:MAG TPA: hypothetical protein [Myoviridae sp. ctI7W9]
MRKRNTTARENTVEPQRCFRTHLSPDSLQLNVLVVHLGAEWLSAS